MILAADEVLGLDWAYGAKHTKFLIAHLIGIEEGGRLHGDKADKLQQVVLDHVTHRAIGIVILGPVADPNAFGDGYLDMVDVIVVPL